MRLARNLGSSSAATALLLLLLGAARLANALCRLRLSVDAAASSFIFSGNTFLTAPGGKTPLTAPVAPVTPAVASGWEGALFLTSSSTSPCPAANASAEQWMSAFASGAFRLSSEVPFFKQGLRVYPPVVPGRVAGGVRGVVGSPAICVTSGNLSPMVPGDRCIG